MKSIKLALIIISVNPTDKNNPKVFVQSDNKIPTCPLSALTIPAQLAILYKDSLQVKNIDSEWLRFELKTVVEDSEAIYIVYKIYFPWIMTLNSTGAAWRSIYEAATDESNKKLFQGEKYAFLEKEAESRSTSPKK
jgi:hypothetical protein